MIEKFIDFIFKQSMLLPELSLLFNCFVFTYVMKKYEWSKVKCFTVGVIIFLLLNLSVFILHLIGYVS